VFDFFVFLPNALFSPSSLFFPHPVQSFDFISGVLHIVFTDSRPLPIMFASQLVRPLLAWLALTTITAAADSDSTLASTTSSASAATHTIKVGHKSDPHQFSPADITANVSDLIVFEFYPTNHSVVKADYLAPCVPASEGLFASGAFEDFNLENGQVIGPVCGIMPFIKAIQRVNILIIVTQPPTWSIRVNNTDVCTPCRNTPNTLIMANNGSLSPFSSIAPR
jgi:plastocyanin